MNEIYDEHQFIIIKVICSSDNFILNHHFEKQRLKTSLCFLFACFRRFKLWRTIHSISDKVLRKLSCNLVLLIISYIIPNLTFILKIIYYQLINKDTHIWHLKLIHTSCLSYGFYKIMWSNGFTWFCLNNLLLHL